jgi:hypothetical protein
MKKEPATVAPEAAAEFQATRPRWAVELASEEWNS